MVTYEELSSKHTAESRVAMPEHLARLAWNADRVSAERERGLRALLGVAKERSPWHRERLAHIDADTASERDLSRIPPMTKDEMMANFDGIVTDRRLSRDVVERHLDSLEDDAYLFDEFHAVASGGSSGTRGIFVYDWAGWLTCRLLLMRYATRTMRRLFGADAAPTLGYVAAGKATHMTYAMVRTFGSGAGAVAVPATLPVSEIVARLNALQPDILGGYPSMLYALAGEATAGRLTIRPRIVRAGSEPLLPEMRAAMESAWACEVVNTLGTSEGASASSCGQSEGMHLNEDLVIFEMVDRDGNPVAPGVRAAKMYITNLYNLAQPLIRYELTDETMVLEGPCACGSAMRRISDIEGRSDDVFTYAGGVVVHPLIFRSRLGHERNIVEYRVTQTPRGAEVAVRTQGDVDVAAVARDLEAELSRLGLATPVVSVGTVDAFDRQATGKLKRFVPLG